MATKIHKRLSAAEPQPNSRGMGAGRPILFHPLLSATTPFVSSFIPWVICAVRSEGLEGRLNIDTTGEVADEKG